MVPITRKAISRNGDVPSHRSPRYPIRAPAMTPPARSVAARKPEDIAPASAFFAGLGTAAAAAGGVLLYLDLSHRSANDRAVSIGAVPSGATLTYRSSF